MRRQLQIVIPRPVYERVMYVARKVAPYEVMFLAEVDSKSASEHVLSDVHLIKQKVSQASAEFDEMALARFVGSHPAPDKLWAWVHSHVNMGNFWSGTDTATMARLVAGPGRLISVVLCLDGTMKGRMDVELRRFMKFDLPEADGLLQSMIERFVPTTLAVDDVPVVVEDFFPASVKESLDTAIRETVECPPEVQVVSGATQIEIIAPNGQRALFNSPNIDARMAEVCDALTRTKPTDVPE